VFAVGTAARVVVVAAAAAMVAAAVEATSAAGVAVLVEPVQVLVQGRGDVSRCADGGGQPGGLNPSGLP